MKFLHIPVQSGSDKVLKEMRREHTVEEFFKIVDRFREEISGINISTDIIIGYPTETEEDFEQTLSFLTKLKPEVLNISKFASRPRTKASKLKQLDSRIIKRRAVIISNEYRKIENNLKFNIVDYEEAVKSEV
ncbi:radical SAM protein [Candidatus Woesearchaeota archaeon]|nr:radical SAM protein [Candidatus Woesearchaeota archaeon]